MLVMIAALRSNFRKDPSLSSDSTTSHSPELIAALVPTSLSSLPITNEGFIPAARIIKVTIEEVVVLPCVPATPIPRRCATTPASASER